MFLYLAYQAVHSPTQAPPASYVGPFNATIPNPKRKTVAGMVSALDEGVGNVTAALKAAGLWSRTFFIFTTDNGGPASSDGNMASN